MREIGHGVCVGGGRERAHSMPPAPKCDKNSSFLVTKMNKRKKKKGRRERKRGSVRRNEEKVLLPLFPPFVCGSVLHGSLS
jgi:hypothetical protein